MKEVAKFDGDGLVDMGRYTEEEAAEILQRYPYYPEDNIIMFVELAPWTEDFDTETYEEWGVQVGDVITSTGQGFWAMKSAHREVERLLHNARLTQTHTVLPKTPRVVRRRRVKTIKSSDWVNVE